MTISQDSFAQAVKDALRCFHDASRLQTHRLTSLLAAPTEPGQTRALTVREQLRAAIETLQPDGRIPFGRQEWLPYRVMWLRYIDGLEPDQVCEELSVGRRSFFRYQQQGTEAVATFLWRQYASKAGVDRTPAAEGAGDIDVRSPLQQEALRVVRESSREWIDVREVLDSVQTTISPVLERKGLSLDLDAPGMLPALHANAAVLRELLLCALTEVTRCVDSARLHTKVRISHAGIVIAIRGRAMSTLDPASVDDAPGFVLCRTLLEVCGGKFSIDMCQDQSLLVSLLLPAGAQKTVLIIEDDADTVRLLRRYLQPHYAVRAISDRDDLDEALEPPPDVILLDILMPERDGWDALQQLRSHERRVPIVVCSVVQEPLLALSLGADHVLQKPIRQDVLLKTIADLLNAKHNAGEERSPAH